MTVYSRRNVKYILIITCCLVVLGKLVQGFIKDSKPFYDSYCLWEADNGLLYRIPGIVSTSTGTLISYCEEREEVRNDWSTINLVYKQSRDGGKTWSERKVLAGNLNDGSSLNNPVMIAGSDGVLHCIYEVMYGIENGGVFYTFSEDDGDTWSETEDITSVTSPDIRNVIATGPGHGIELKNGTLMVPVWMVLKQYNQSVKSYTPAVVSTLYSLDNGKGWSLGEILYSNEQVTDPNESSLVQLSDGRVLINTRNNSENRYRAIAISDTGYSEWSSYKHDEELIDPVCFGSLFKYSEDIILFVNNKSVMSRDNITVYISMDDCETWSKGITIQNTGGYADACVGKDKTIYVVSEQFKPGEDIYSINLHKFNMNWLLDMSNSK